MFEKLYFLTLLILNFHNEERCVLNSRFDFGWPAPIVIRDNALLQPNDRDGNVNLRKGEPLTLSCEGTGNIRHPNSINARDTATVTCEGGTNFKNDDWLSALSSFRQFTCSESVKHTAQKTTKSCNDFVNRVVEVGYKVQNAFYPVYESCFDEGSYTPIYSNYTQKPYNAAFQTGSPRPFFVADNIYGSIPVDALFCQGGQRNAVYQAVGSLIDRYVTNTQFLSRGHLAARTDFVFDFGQRATFHYTNCAPQWYGFNSGNWNTLEIDLRNRVHRAGLDTIIYTGTYGVASLLDQNDRRVNLYLYRDQNNNPAIPVPEYYYKVVYEPSTHRGIVFVGINNPYYTKEEARQKIFCNDICIGNSSFSWLTWHPKNPTEGFCFCCEYNDFKRVVNHLPREIDVREVLI